VYTCTGANVKTLNGAAAFPRDLCRNVVGGKVARVIGGCRHIEISAKRVEPTRRAFVWLC